jgi:hypothetical protein
VKLDKETKIIHPLKNEGGKIKCINYEYNKKPYLILEEYKIY